MQPQFGHLITAMITPFNTDNQLNIDALEEIIEYLIENATDSLVVSGTTGESPTLTHEEDYRLMKETVRIVRAGYPLSLVRAQIVPQPLLKVVKKLKL